jgi:hypothetical protein
MDFPFGQTIYRDRRDQVTDPYNPSRTADGDWDAALTITLAGAFIASSSSVSPSDATRDEILTNKSLYVTDPAADVRPRDRIRTAGMAFDGSDGTRPFYVRVRPDADINPFTGWQPVVEIPLELVEG